MPLLGPVRSVKMGLDYAAAMVSGVINGKPPASYEDLLGVGGGDTDRADLRSRQLLLVYLVIDEDRVLAIGFSFRSESSRAVYELVFEPLWKSSDEDLAKRCLRVESVGVTSEDRLSASFVKRFRDFYPVYSIDYRERLAERYARLRVVDNLIPTGRLGMFNYNNSDHCLDMGRFIAEGVANGDTAGDIWDALEKRVRSYRIVD